MTLGSLPPDVSSSAAPSRRWLKAALWVGVAAAALWGGKLWWYKPAAPVAAARPLAVVVAATARVQDMARHDVFLGTIKAVSAIQIKSRITGQIVETFVQDGQRVTAGQKLFRIDERPFQAALEQAEGVLARDEAQLANARNDLSRYGDLSKKGFASGQQYEQSLAQVKALAGTVMADRAAVDLARLNLEYCTITAPMAGKLGRVLLPKGGLVASNDANVLVELSVVQPVRVSFALPQQLIPLVQTATALPVVVSVDGDTRGGVQGVVDYLAPQVQVTTGTLEALATLANDDLRLVPGQQVQVSLRLAELPQSVVVPVEAINSGQNGSYVYVLKPVDGGTVAEVRPVAVSYREGGLAVVSRGVAAGENVVVEGQLRVKPGSKVTVRTEAKSGESH